MKLPNPENAIIDEQKLAGYSLNPNHSEGKHKARVFKSALNLTLDNLDELKNALLFAVKTYDAIPDKTNTYGQKYIIDFLLTRENKTAIIHSVWIIRNNEQIPRLVTCYIL
ncbi:conserved hypothetical protein [Planktothrix sp. PCC 11201]|uniref:DUF6883 domain-containing protein n=1 Tax=Planktothrix sp. PCC 11201 TaxID=1729650 RepID=UPI0009191F7F|nr:DUF6883 domain-containing protein [Planktothrix sp. PCC 11201]SKB11678.1 conserved hypothetical protein [Planktothrix sp. PCC 11201]